MRGGAWVRSVGSSFDLSGGLDVTVSCDTTVSGQPHAILSTQKCPPVGVVGRTDGVVIVSTSSAGSLGYFP